MTDTGYIQGRTIRYLTDISVGDVKGIGSSTQKPLAELGIHSVADLLLTVPRRYLDRSQLAEIGTSPIDEEITIGGIVQKFSKRRITRGRTMVEARVSDGTGTVRVVWFNPYLKLDEGEEVALSGKVEMFRGTRQMKSPAVDRLSRETEGETGRVVPVYPKIGTIKPGTVRNWMANAVRRSLPIVDAIPEDTLDRYDLVDRSTAIEMIHLPESIGEATPARKRLAFDEFLRIQMALKARGFDEYESQVGVSNSLRGPLFVKYLEALPFSLTADQQTALDDIMGDMAAGTPLHRMLQGEVGSGKTVVVVAALLTSVESGHQAAFMAPTEVLAGQHYLGTARALSEAGLAPSEFLSDGSGTDSLFTDGRHDRPVRVGLFTSARVSANFVHGEVSREQGLAWLADGTIDIAFGTHALIQPDVTFASLGITVVDEQHRFGVEQRVSLRERDNAEGVPDLLLMTATPIPRTLVMSLYGDLDVSTIRTLPPGRSETRTEAIPFDRKADSAVDQRIATEVGEGRQVFVVCPLVDDSDKLDAVSAVGEYSRLTAAHPTLNVELLHGQMSSDDKAEVMERVRLGEIDVLAATTVIEVGIDVPNATLMVIRNAERFGLSQLHQLRGRVGRGQYGGTCLLVSDASNADAERRLGAMVATTDGFELAEVDLEIRGHGTLFGSSQSGMGDLRIGNVIRDRALIEAAAECAAEAVHADRSSEFVRELVDEFRIFIGDRADWLDRS